MTDYNKINLLISVIGISVVFLFIVFFVDKSSPVEVDAIGARSIEPVKIIEDIDAVSWAEIDRNGVVLRVIVADYDFIMSGAMGSPDKWVATYKDRRKKGNYAGIDYTYDATNNIFLPPKQYDSWVVNTKTTAWIAPKSKPKDTKDYKWDENIQDWEVYIDDPRDPITRYLELQL